MIHLSSFLAILTMACVTYLTRICGYLLLSHKELSTRTKACMDIMPGCVLISIIAPAFASGHIADLIGLALTCIAAMRFSLLPTMLCGIFSTGILRTLFHL